MKPPKFITAVTVLFLLSITISSIFNLASCCAPNACRYAKSGSDALAKSITSIEEYKGRNGKYPVVLDDIEKGFGNAQLKELQAACPECGELQYRTDAYGYELEYQYRHMGPNWCIYTSETSTWNCHGNY